MKTYTDSPYLSLQEVTLGDLSGKNGYLLELGNADNTVQLASGPDTAIGVMFEKFEKGDTVSVRLLGKGGTVKVVAGGGIAKGGRVVWGTGGKVVAMPTTTGTYRTLGRSLTPGTTADGDVIEILDVIERVAVA